MMPWGINDRVLDKRSRGFGSESKTDVVERSEIVFVTSNQRVRSYFHQLTEVLAFSDTFIIFSDGQTRTLSDDVVADKLLRAKAIIIGTCNVQSLIKDSHAQKLEAMACEAATKRGIPLAIFSQSANEPVQPHLAQARDHNPLIIVEEDFTGFGGFLEMFRSGSHVVRAGYSGEDYQRVAKAIAMMR